MSAVSRARFLADFWILADACPARAVAPLRTDSADGVTVLDLMCFAVPPSPATQLQGAFKGSTRSKALLCKEAPWYEGPRTVVAEGI